MKGHRLSIKEIEAFRYYLREEEKSQNTQEKYIRDVTAFCSYCPGIWKHPCEDFNSLTQLIVHESQEAIFFMNGQALDLFGAGRYTLETQNIPRIGKILNRTTGDQTPFHCEVYFINKQSRENKTVPQSIPDGIDCGTCFYICQKMSLR